MPMLPTRQTPNAPSGGGPLPFYFRFQAAYPRCSLKRRLAKLETMPRLIPKSLVSRLTLLVTTWLISAFIAISITMLLSLRLEGGAAAVNDTGGLRYQTYRLRLYLNDTSKVQSLIQTFDQTLARLHHSDPTRPLNLPQDRSIQQHLKLLQQYWETQIKPQYQSPNPNLALLDNHLIPNFVASIDSLTRTIEHNNAYYVQWLRVFQTALMVLIFVVSGITIILLKIWIIRPLKNLETGVIAIQNSQFGEHIPEDNSTEFAIVDNGFNRMSSHLARLYGKLEQQVAEKTQDLVRKNHTLNTLYTVAQELNQTQTIRQAAQTFLPHILALTRPKPPMCPSTTTLSPAKAKGSLKPRPACRRSHKALKFAPMKPHWAHLFYTTTKGSLKTPMADWCKPLCTSLPWPSTTTSLPKKAANTPYCKSATPSPKACTTASPNRSAI